MANQYLYPSYVSLFLVFFSAFTCSSQAFQYTVGGKDGWVVKPSENYNHWAQRMRFQVNDTLLFKYKQGSDSVMVVHQQDYDDCNTGNPINKMDDGNSIYRFDHSGPFFFITGNKSNCDAGQKLIIVVMAVRKRLSPPPSPKAPAPTPHAAAPSPSISPSHSFPPAEAPAPGPSASSDSPADVNATEHPPHRSFAAPAFSTPSVVVVVAVTLVLSVCMGGYIVSV